MKPLRLKTGDLGDDVARLHEQLALYGVDVSPEERKRKFFGPSTREAVRVFQRTHGLDLSGEVCNQTAALLSSPPLGVSTVPNSMRIRFGIGETGTFVERLHRVLMSEGHAIERNELDRCEFGASTLAALQAFQLQQGLQPTEEIDEATLEILLQFEQNIEQNITININEGSAPTPPTPPNQQRGVVSGKLVDADGTPITNTLITLISQQIRTETNLGNATTSKTGQYSITYARKSALNLIAQASDAKGNVIAASKTIFAAPTQVEIDLTTAEDGVVRTPSQFTTLEAEVAAGLPDNTSLQDLQENKDTHELTFLANSISVAFTQVAYLFIAVKLGLKDGLRPETLFGLFSQGTPPSLNAALNNLPDAGIDDAFTAQILSAVLTHSRSVLDTTLNSAVTSNILPASYTDVQESELSRLDALRVANIGSAPYIRGKTALNDLLAAGTVAQNVQTAFVESYAANGRRLGPTWDALRANKNLSTADLDTLNTVLNTGELLAGNLPMLKDTLQRLSQKTIPSLANLALLDQSDWENRIRLVDPNATSLPKLLPTSSTEDLIANFAKSLTKRFAQRYPTMAFAGGLAKASASSFATKDELISFISANPTLSFRGSNIDQFIATNKLTISLEALAELKITQRLHRLSPNYASVEALHGEGYKSAQSIYFKGRAPFLEHMTTALGSTTLASKTYARAQMTYATALMAFGRYNGALNGVNVSSMANPSPDVSTIANLPDLQALFGSLDYFQCEDCQSVYSPAAYLVDLLEYLKKFSVTPLVTTLSLPPNPNARDALFLRRPEIPYVALDCDNTNIVIPYIDLVNEILEGAIAPSNIQRPQVITTEGTTAERRALPQQTQPLVAAAAYTATQGAVFPLSLPFDVDFAKTEAYIAALDTTRAALLRLFPGVVNAATIATATLGINSALQEVINQASATPWTRWGFTQPLSAPVIDPKTRLPYSSTNPSDCPNPPSDWIQALKNVPVLLNRSGLSLQQLYQLLEVVWVTQAGVTLQAGTMPIMGTMPIVQILNPNTDCMIFKGLDSNVLDRANRFLRLWTATGLQMWELDWALEPTSGELDDTFLTYLSDAMTVQTKLNLPFQEILTFWAEIETRDVTSHLGDEDVVIPSTYSEVFANPTMTASWGTLFTKSIAITAASNSSPIIISTALPHCLQSGIQVTISGVQGNTAANGNFKIAVTSPMAATFTLVGSIGNGDWLGGGAVTTLSGAQIVYSALDNPSPDELQPLNGIVAALGLNAADICAIQTASGATNFLCLPILTWLLRYARLATSLSLTVSDLILWIALTGISPFGGNPSNTIEFLRRLAVLQGTSIAVHDLDYLLRGQSTSQSALAFTDTQSTAVLQTIRDAVAKAVTTSQLTLTSVSNATPISVSTTKPHGLVTGMEVLITGVQGNTAANGIFTITVPSVPNTPPVSFTLNGAIGNGDWSGGGSVIAYLDPNPTMPQPNNLEAAIQTIVIAALATATGVTADVVTSVLLKTGVLPLDAPTMELLLSPTQGTVDPTQFPALITAFTQVAKACALFTALATSPDSFSFLVKNATTYGWLDPSTLPLAPVIPSPYSSFEALLRALKLEQRQTARTSKLFDVLTQWLVPSNLPADVQTAIGGSTIQVTGASNTPPIAITTSTPHGLQSGTQVVIGQVQGNTAANGTFTITVTGSNSFTLDGSSGNGIWTGGGVVTLPNVPTLAQVLNASISDVTAIATKLGAKPPSLNPANQAGTMADIATLTAIANALDVVVRYKIDGQTLVQLATPNPDSTTAAAAMGVLQAQYPQSAWLTAVQPVEDKLRQARRDALVAYLLGPGPVTSPGAQFLTTDDIYNYYLIDPEMSACGETTRLLQPSLAIQQFVQQCFLNLTINVTVDLTNKTLWDEWSWRRQYRLWQANREVFLYPENYLLPELRTNKSSFFTDLENDLRQTNCDADAAEAAFENYLRKLVEVANLVVAAHYNQINPDGSEVLYVFAHTRGTPPKWFYRTRTTQPLGSGVWSAWTSLNLDIPCDPDGTAHLMPVVWDRRLHLVWAIFKQIAEKQGDQQVPSSGGGAPQSPPAKFWAVQFAMSEFSAGQWQAKRTIDEKMYFNTEDSPLSFMFRAFQDNSFNLQLQVYYMPDVLYPGGLYKAKGTMPVPDAPFSICEDILFLPPENSMDLSQEPSYSTIKKTNLPYQFEQTPGNYDFKGQDLVYGGWRDSNPSSPVSLSVMNIANSNGVLNTITLLCSITNPRIVVPQQEAIFDSSNPFFVTDPQRTYLVQPYYYNFTSTNQQQQETPQDPDNLPVNIDRLVYALQWQTGYQFQTFYHPYARTFLRELEIGGIPQLMSRNLQCNPQTVRGRATFDFNEVYQPTGYVAKPYPGYPNPTNPSETCPDFPDPGETCLDFDPGCSGAYSLYNWEVFYHGPMFVASLLMQNQQYQDAMTWLEYIFNPTDNGTVPGCGSAGSQSAPQRFWETAPFNAMNADDWTNNQIKILITLAAYTQQGISDPSTVNAINAWMNDPFDPHMVASTRISAYGKATVMKFLDNLLAWGDSLYAQYTAEMVSQAEQLYILADMILGPAPDQLRLPTSQQGTAPTYASLKNIDLFSNVLVNVENVIIAPEPPQSIIDGSASTPSLPQFPGNGTSTLLFCIPPNDQLLAYWGEVAQRLYNIRHCLNLQGVAQPLPLYAPPINPLQLIAAKASGASASGAASSAPIYRFATYLQKAVELTNDVRAYGQLILSALEKQDAETLAACRATQELNIQTLMLDVKAQQVTEAQDQITALQNQYAVTQIRCNFYSNIAFMNTWEITAISLQGGALIANGVAVVLDMVAGAAHLFPKLTAGAAGFGATPTVTATYGGDNIGHSATAWSDVARGLAGILSEGGAMAATMGGYQRRQDEWTLQANLAKAELTQISSQITAANDRLGIAQKELSIQQVQINNAQAISDFLNNKYTNAQLYNWMITRLTTVYTQAYQLAFSLALQAQTAYQYELGRPTDNFINYAYWDSQHKGLTAGDSLLFDLRRMESQYLANNLRELELTKHISLALTQPMQLVCLLQTGSCVIALDETLFDSDHPGHYFRRLRSVALTIPCVSGPYTSVNATLSLGSAVVRTVAPSTGYQPYIWNSTSGGPSTSDSISASPPMATMPIIATSSGQNDSGLFEVNLRDERWLPFEGQGAVSMWSLTLDPRDNNFDLSTVTDVVLHIRYSARFGGDPAAVRQALKPQNSRSILVSVRHTFPDAYYSFFNPTDSTVTQQTLTLPLTNAIFPFSNLGMPKITDMTIIVALAEPMSQSLASALSGIMINGTFGLTSSSTTPGNVVLKPVTNGTAPSGGAIAALTSSDISLTSKSAPASFTLTIPQAGLPPSLVVPGQAHLDPSLIDDIVLLITYEIG